MAAVSPLGVPSPGTSDLAKRTVSAVVLAGIVLAAAWVGGWLAATVMAVAAALVMVEWGLLTTAGLSGWPLLAPPALIFAAVQAAAAMPAVGLAIAATAAVVAAVAAKGPWLAGGAVYAALFGLSLILLRDGGVDGLTALLFVFAVVWAADTGAYFAGRAIGGPKLWPRVSPKKTWSGFVGGLLAALAAGFAVAAALGVMPTLGLSLTAVALAVVSVAGDLFESAVKRRFGAKDSGNLIPGHGGIMDRVDGLVFASALAFLIGTARGGLGDAGSGLVRW